MKQVAVVLGLVWMIVPASHAESQMDSPEDEVFAVGQMADGDTWMLHDLEVPPGARTVTISLLTALTQSVDLDLIVYGEHPQSSDDVGLDDFYDSEPEPLCVSDNAGGREVCVVERPESGRLWIAVELYEGKGDTAYQLRYSYVELGDVDPSYDPLPLNSSVLLNNNERGYYIQLDQGEVATLVLEGTERTISVRDDNGKEYAARYTYLGRKQVWLAAPFESSDAIMTGLPQPLVFTVTIGAFIDPFNQRVSELSLIGPREEEDSHLIAHFLIPFSPDQSEVLKVDRGGRLKKTSGDLKQMAAAYFIPRRKMGTIATIAPNDLFILAICDGLGNVYDLSTDSVILSPGLGGEEDLYLVVTKSPFSQGTRTKYVINFWDDYSQIKK